MFLLEILFAIFITFILIKSAQHFDKIASEIDVIPLVVVTAVAGIVFNVLTVSFPIANLFTLPIIFIAAAIRLRKYELQDWSRTILYSFLVICSFGISGLLLHCIIN